MPAGRPPLGPDLIDRLGTTHEAKTRLKVILETIAGTRTIEEACAQLEVSESRFHELRAEALSGAAAALEPSPRGRPRKKVDPSLSEVETLKQRVTELEREVIFAKTRAVVATAFPHLIKDPNEKKKNPREERRKKRKAQRKRRGK